MEGKVPFEPSDFYLHEVLCFNVQHASIRDKVQSFNEANAFWERDNFLQACHGKVHTDDKSREGRKLKIAEYYQKMKHTPL